MARFYRSMPNSRFSATPRRRFGRFRRRLRNADTPPRWEQFQFSVNTVVQASSVHDYDDTHLFFAVPVIDMFTFTVGPGGTQESDIQSAMSHLEIGGMVWHSTAWKIAPGAEVLTEIESVAETLYLQRTFLDGTPVSFPSPWQSTPPWGGGFAEEQYNIPTRFLSRRELATTGFANDYPWPIADFPTKSLRLKRRLGQNTSLVLQWSFTSAEEAGEYALRSSGVVYYRVKF